jgi:putative transcriptional regulator
MIMDRLRSGDILVAPPAMRDHRFRQTALLLTYHDLDGSLAICLNRPTTHSLDKISEEVGLDQQLNFPLYWGGPVNPGTVWMLHSTEWQIDNTVEVNQQWSLTSNEQMFWAAQEGDLPRYFRFFHGFCSWTSQQLDHELEGRPPWTHQSSWLTVEQPDAETLLEIPLEHVWQHCLTVSSQQAVSSWL